MHKSKSTFLGTKGLKVSCLASCWMTYFLRLTGIKMRRDLYVHLQYVQSFLFFSLRSNVKCIRSIVSTLVLFSWLKCEHISNRMCFTLSFINSKIQYAGFSGLILLFEFMFLFSSTVYLNFLDVIENHCALYTQYYRRKSTFFQFYLYHRWTMTVPYLLSYVHYSQSNESPLLVKTQFLIQSKCASPARLEREGGYIWCEVRTYMNGGFGLPEEPCHPCDSDRHHTTEKEVRERRSDDISLWVAPLLSHYGRNFLKLVGMETLL